MRRDGNLRNSNFAHFGPSNGHEMVIFDHFQPKSCMLPPQNARFWLKYASKPTFLHTEMPKLVNAVSDSVYFGPYRTLFNAPATITIPIDRTKVSDASKIQAYIFNDLSQTFDPLFSVPGGTTISVDINEGTASFDTQVLGVFVIGIK